MTDLDVLRALGRIYAMTAVKPRKLYITVVIGAGKGSFPRVLKRIIAERYLENLGKPRIGPWRWRLDEVGPPTLAMARETLEDARAIANKASTASRRRHADTYRDYMRNYMRAYYRRRKEQKQHQDNGQTV